MIIMIMMIGACSESESLRMPHVHLNNIRWIISESRTILKDALRVNLPEHEGSNGSPRNL